MFLVCHLDQRRSIQVDLTEYSKAPLGRRFKRPHDHASPTWKMKMIIQRKKVPGPQYPLLHTSVSLSLIKYLSKEETNG